MKHRHDRQDDVASLDMPSASPVLTAISACSTLERWRIEHALGIAGRARGVAKPAGRVLVELAPRRNRRRIAPMQILIGDQRSGSFVSGMMGAVGQATIQASTARQLGAIFSTSGTKVMSKNSS